MCKPLLRALAEVPSEFLSVKFVAPVHHAVGPGDIPYNAGSSPDKREFKMGIPSIECSEYEIVITQTRPRRQ